MRADLWVYPQAGRAGTSFARTRSLLRTLGGSVTQFLPSSRDHVSAWVRLSDTYATACRATIVLGGTHRNRNGRRAGNKSIINQRKRAILHGLRMKLRHRNKFQRFSA